MNKLEFLQYLEKGLKTKHVKDVDDIIVDYQEYFDKQLSLGKTESDVVMSIGDPDSIISDYVEIGVNSRKKWFEIVTISMVALPLLIINYGLVIIFIGASVSFWGFAVYYAFGLDSLGFMPSIPLLPKVFFILLGLISAVFMMTTSIRYYGVLKSMTQQYIVKQSIRIGDYRQLPIYEKISKWSLIAFVFVIVFTYAVSAIVAKDFQFWHVWEWFQ